MAVFWVTTCVPTTAGGRFQFPFEAAADDVDGLVAAMDRDGRVVGDKLTLGATAGADGREVVARERVALYPAGVGLVQPYVRPLWEAE